MSAERAERRWDQEMLEICRLAAALGYRPTYLLRMIQELGGLAAAKQLLSGPSTSEGFTRLYEMGRLDLSVEARAQKTDYDELFTATDRVLCRRRLADHGWDRDPPWLPR